MAARQYYIRVGLDATDTTRRVIRVVCDGEFVLHDRQGKVLYTGQGDTPLRFTCHDAKRATTVYYHILTAFERDERVKAETFAARAREKLGMTVNIIDDPRDEFAPRPVGALEPPQPLLAVVVGPVSRVQADANEDKIKKSYKPQLFHTLSAPAEGRVEARDEKGRLVAQAAAYVGVRPKKRDSLTRARRLNADYEAWADPDQWKTRENRAYRGLIEIWVDPKAELTLVNRIFLEHYLYGVVPIEIGTQARFESTKAQAVIARSEGIHKLRMHRHAGQHFDLCDSPNHCQAYKGAFAETAHTNSAVDATWGQVCVHGNEIADTVYSQSCGGVTANSEDLWEGEPSPYLQSRIDAVGDDRNLDLSRLENASQWLLNRPGMLCSPNQTGFPNYLGRNYYRWNVTYSASGLASIVRRNNSLSGAIVNISVVRRMPSGRVLEIAIETSSNDTIHIKREDAIRKSLGVKSTFFILSRQYDSNRNLTQLTITGAGFGHGAGLCQSGADMMAYYGFDYAAILKHYFHGVDIYKIYQ